ncbi:MAG: acetylglutamate kinase, partial [Planctomycetota bacterium]
MENYELIIRFFQGIGAPKEADGYLRLFHKGDPSRFAVIKVGGKILQQSKDLLAFDLAYLSKLDLFPIVIHGGGPQIDVELAARGIESRKIGGIRVTPREAVEVIRDVLMSANSEVVQAVRDASGTAIGVNSGIFRAERVADPELGYVGEVTGVDLKQIVRAVRADMIPIVNPIGFGTDGQAYNINADTAARALVLALKPKKFILITEEGGVRGADGEILPYINLNQDYDRLVKTGVISGGMLVKVREIKELLERTKGRMVVTIASAENLLKELFTAKGAGTFVKLGSRIREVHSWRGVNVDRTRRLIERSFGKPLTRGYFRRPVKYVFYEENYKGCAV